MLSAIGSSLVAFALSFVLLMGIERLLHKVTRNRSVNYRWGVWVFSVLIAIYFYVAQVGQ